MRKHHHKTLKFHTIFTLCLIAVCVIALLISPDWMLFIACLALVVYVAGNGIIHTRKNQLTRDSVIEYVLVGAIVTVVVLSAVVN